jgi:hypothetical protein
MKRLQRTRGRRLTLAAAAAALAATTTLDAQSAVLRMSSSDSGLVELLSRRGVFEGADDGEPATALSAADRRIQWLTFYLIYAADEVLSRYAPGGAAGARFDLFQFAGFPDGQPHGYAIHIVVTDRRVTLTGGVDSEADRILAETRAREVPGVVDVHNALAVAR